MKIHITILTALALLTAPSAFADAAATYKKECASCHGADGKGNTKMGKKLKIKDMGSELAKISDAQAAKIIKDGVSEGGKVRMKPAKVAEGDIPALVKYIRTL